MASESAVLNATAEDEGIAVSVVLLVVSVVVFAVLMSGPWACVGTEGGGGEGVGLSLVVFEGSFAVFASGRWACVGTEVEGKEGFGLSLGIFEGEIAVFGSGL